MAITIPSYDAINAYVLAVYRNRFPGKDLSFDSYLGKQARAESMVILQLLQAVVSADNDAIPGTKTSTAALDAWALAIGLVASPGVLGRKAGTAALGIAGSPSGTNATSIPDGSTLTASDGVTTFKLNNAGAPLLIPGSAPGTGSVAGTFDAVTAGLVGNQAVGSVLTWTSPPAGLDPTVKTTALPTTLGIDIESDSALLTRILTKMQAPAKGGASVDYRVWGESVSGVARAYPYPLRGGLGTVQLLITSGGSGGARVPSKAGTQTAVQNNVDNYINGSATTVAQRPVTVQGYKSLLPNMPGASTKTKGSGSGNTGGLTIKLRLVPSKTKYSFDWTDSGTGTATNYTAGTNGAADTLLHTGTAADITNIKNAIDNKLNPRIQLNVLTAGAPANLIPVQVTAYNGGSSTTTTLTLQNPLPTGWVAPTNGATTSLWAAGPMVAPINTAILNYIDSLGPSKAGGYAETLNDYWEDTVAIDRILQIALSTTDTDGTRFANNAVGGGLTNVTIANGTNAAASTDITALDLGTDTTIELMWAFAIIVIQ